METRIMKILSKNGSVPLKLIYGHFATNHSHINCYLDMTTLKTRQSEAQLAAQALVQHYVATTIVDTILCLDGTQIIGPGAEPGRVCLHQRPPDHLRGHPGVRRHQPAAVPG